MQLLLKETTKKDIIYLRLVTIVFNNL